ncbi:serine/arginine-rich splicing factor 3-like isoform X2 [Lampetra fluviatilis]
MSFGRDNGPVECKVYVGNLGSNASEYELEKVFSHYGPLRSVWVARNPPGFAFVQFEDTRDARDACRELDGRLICGSRASVEMSTGERRQKRFGGPAPPWQRSDYGGRRRSPSPRRSPRRSPSPRRRSSVSPRRRSPVSPSRRRRSLSRSRSPRRVSRTGSRSPGPAKRGAGTSVGGGPSSSSARADNGRSRSRS